jgi:hypothetical protein
VEFDTPDGPATLSFLATRGVALTNAGDEIPIDGDLVKGLSGMPLRAAVLYADGTIEIELEKLAIRIAPDPEVESWEFVAPSFFAVSPAGGGEPPVWERNDR